nr:uncharacterized protein LOC111517106 isoform X2 [Leptinotarsa decemlineata]
MGKICAIKSCSSGRKRLKDSQEPMSFFQARSWKLASWRKSLRMNLKETDYICQLHFKKDYIEMYDEITVGNDVHYRYLSQKKLKEDALPTIEHQYEFDSESQKEQESIESLECRKKPKCTEMDPLSLSLLENMDQVEFVIDSDEEGEYSENGNAPEDHGEEQYQEMEECDGDIEEQEMEECDGDIEEQEGEVEEEEEGKVEEQEWEIEEQESDKEEQEYDVEEQAGDVEDQEDGTEEQEDEEGDIEEQEDLEGQAGDTDEQNDIEEKNDTEDESFDHREFIERDTGNIIEIHVDEDEDEVTEVAPFKKMKISNVMSVNDGTAATSDAPSEERIVKFRTKIKELLSKNASAVKIPTDAPTPAPPSGVLSKASTSDKENIRSPARENKKGALGVPDGTSVGIKGVAKLAPAKVKIGQDLKKVVVVNNQQEFPLEEDPCRINPCFVPGCKIYKNEQMFAFGVPQNEATLKIWDMCIDNKEHKLDFNHVICYKHFSQDDVLHNIRIINKNGEEIAVDEPKLRKGAFPCVKYWNVCCIRSCKKTTGRMFTFPVEKKDNLNLWMYLIKNPDLKKLPLKELLRNRVCEIHFEPASFDEEGDLTYSAAPTLFLPESVPLTVPQTSNVGNRIKQCIFRKCGGSSRRYLKKVFSFPDNFQRLYIWLEACKRVDLVGKTLNETLEKLGNVGVCDYHFDLTDYENSALDKLKDSAVPKNRRRLVENGEAVETGAVKRPNPIKLIPILTDSCIYRGCKSKATEENPFFFFPSEANRYKDWMAACGYSYSGPNFYAYKICPKHFSKEMFNENGFLLENAKPDLYPDPKLISLSIPIVHPKKFLKADMTSQKFRTENTVETVLTFGNDREVIIIQDVINNDAEDDAGEGELICAVKNCKSVYKTSTGQYHRFPEPRTDSERFDIWRKLVANSNLDNISRKEICRKYMVCKRHFEKRFYTRSIPTLKEKVLSLEAVPTLHLPADSCLLKEWDNYKDRLKKYLDALAKENAEEDEEKDELVCAVKNCTSVYKISTGQYHRFPDPKTDSDRFDIWQKFVANNNLDNMTPEEICKKYMVCMRHFEKRFYTRRIPTLKEKVLSLEAVPTLHLPADSCLLKEWDYYKDRLKKYLDAPAKEKGDIEIIEDEKEGQNNEHDEGPPKKKVVSSWVATETVRLSDLHDKTRCVLEKDRLSFPGMGCNLFITSNDTKARFPYNVYRAFPTCYGMSNTVKPGENVHIHTAIIIDDDDECERQVLQQLMDRRKKRKKNLGKPAEETAKEPES